MSETTTVTRSLVSAPLPQIIERLGLSIAQAQAALDNNSVKVAQAMAETPVELGGQTYNLLTLGFTPSFYQFVDTVIELKLSISINSERSSTHKRSQVKSSAKGVGLPFFAAGSVSASSVSASYASKYQYSAEGSSVMRTKLVPVPAPAILEERIRALIDAEADE